MNTKLSTLMFENEDRGMEMNLSDLVRGNTSSHLPVESVDEADDTIWILTSTFIIFTMQSGFGLLESGSVSTKNEANIMVKNAADVIFGGLTYWAFGYAISFGEAQFSNPFCGWGHFFIEVDEHELAKVYAKFFFQASFATTATTIVSGCMAERTKLTAYICFSTVNTVTYCFPAHWVWGTNGWLAQLGMIDIAGAGPVHLVGGITGLVATLMLKPRHRRYETSHPPKMGSPTNALLGTFMLWWGWLGFNCGSTFGISGNKWILAARSAVSTMLASIAGGAFGISSSYVLNNRQFDISFMINSILGSLVGITGFCALAAPWESFLVGAVGAMMALTGIYLLEKLHIDDPVGAVGVHAFSSCWSILVPGLFAKPDSYGRALGYDKYHYGLFYGGGFYLLGVQALGAACIIAWTLLTSFVILKGIDHTIGLRMPLHEEILGADIVEHGIGIHNTTEISKQTKSSQSQTEHSYLTNGVQSSVKDIVDDTGSYGIHTLSSNVTNSPTTTNIKRRIRNGTADKQDSQIYEKQLTHAYGSHTLQRFDLAAQMGKTSTLDYTGTKQSPTNKTTLTSKNETDLVSNTISEDVILEVKNMRESQSYCSGFNEDDDIIVEETTDIMTEKSPKKGIDNQSFIHNEETIPGLNSPREYNDKFLNGESSDCGEGAKFVKVKVEINRSSNINDGKCRDAEENGTNELNITPEKEPNLSPKYKPGFV